MASTKKATKQSTGSAFSKPQERSTSFWGVLGKAGAKALITEFKRRKKRLEGMRNLSPADRTAREKWVRNLDAAIKALEMLVDNPPGGESSKR